MMANIKWVHSVFAARKFPRVKCGDCNHQAYLPVSDEVIREHLQGKQTISVYLQLLVNEIVLTGNNVTVKGGYIPLAGALKLAAQKKKLSTPQEVLSFNKDWRPRDDSNVRPLP